MRAATLILSLTATSSTVIALSGLVPAAAAGTPTCAGQRATRVVTSSSPHVVRGTSHRDVVIGGSGNDEPLGRGGKTFSWAASVTTRSTAASATTPGATRTRAARPTPPASTADRDVPG